MDEELDQIINFLNDKEFQQQVQPLSQNSKSTEAVQNSDKKQIKSQLENENQQIDKKAQYVTNKNKFDEESKQLQLLTMNQVIQQYTPSNQNISQMNNQRQEMVYQVPQGMSNSSQNINMNGIDNQMFQQKKNDFIIRKGGGIQNKRVISQIRNNFQQTLNSNNMFNGGGIPPMQKGQTQTTSGKKKKHSAPTGQQQQQQMQPGMIMFPEFKNHIMNGNDHVNISHISDYGKLLMNQIPHPLSQLGSNNIQQQQQRKIAIANSSLNTKQKQLRDEGSLNKKLLEKKLEIENQINQRNSMQPEINQNEQIIQQQKILKQNRIMVQQENPQDPKLDAENILPEEISSKIKKKFLIFRPYEDPIQIRPYQPPDRGYYFKLYNNEVKIIRYTLEDNGFRENPNKDGKDWTIMWSCCALKPQVYQSLSRYQKVNHFPSSFHITRKDLMYKAVSKMREIHGQKHFNFIPKTFLLPNEFVYLEAEMERDKEKLWIAKPAASSQGKGIVVTNKISEIPNKGNPHIVSEYIYNPLLFDGFKFDLRVYVAITSVNPLRIYVYDEGLTRFATSKYNNNITGNKKQSKYTHLTNYSLNKNNPNFIANTDPNADGVGSKWSLTALKKAFKEQGIDYASVWKKIEDIVIKTILAGEQTLFQASEQQCQFRNNCFELLGFDILIDDCLDPWLLEVNLSPSLNCDSPLDQKVKAQLIADLFTLAGITPLEQRQANGNEVIHSKKQGVIYGAYQQESGNNTSMVGGGNKRETHTAGGSNKRKEQRGQQLGDTSSSAFGYGVVKVQTFTTKQEKQLIKETEQEFKRRGRFKRVFPSVDYNYYKQFFVEERPMNILLDQKVMSKRRLNNAVASAMSVKQRIDYLNNIVITNNQNNNTLNSQQIGLYQQPNIKSQVQMYRDTNNQQQQQQQHTVSNKQNNNNSHVNLKKAQSFNKKEDDFSNGEMADNDDYSSANCNEREIKKKKTLKYKIQESQCLSEKKQGEELKNSQQKSLNQDLIDINNY